MPSTTFTLEQQNSREQVLSTDLNRMQKLASREAQDVLMNASRRDNLVNEDGVVLAGHNYEGVVVNRADVLGTITGASGSYDVTLSAGQVFMDITTTDPESSDYSIVRWPATTFTTITPDAGTFRVDLIIATPAMVQTDLQSRNILVDPVARTVTPANVYKTSNPLATLTVVTGTPGDPSAPAVPVGLVALWEVISFNTDGDSTTYRFIPRIWRRVESFATCHAILENCVPIDGGLHVETISVPPALPFGKVHRAIIDGEVVCAAVPGFYYVGALQATPDTNNNPLTATISTWRDLPLYLYLCGGRHAPQNGTGVVPSPLRLVSSLTPPTVSNRASADLAIAGVTVPKAGTLYAGLWFIAYDGHNYKSCMIEDDWIHARTHALHVAIAAFWDVGMQRSGVSGNLTLNVPSVPTSSPMVDLMVKASDSTAPAAVALYALAGGVDDYRIMTVTAPGPTLIRSDFLYIRTTIPEGGAFSFTGGNATSLIEANPVAFKMNVPRIG